MNSFTEENYLKAIYKLSLQELETISTNAIAALVNTKAATVTDMLKKLSEKNYVSYQKYQGVSLTAEGKKIALKIVRKHRLWEVFLVEKLNFRWDEVHDIAEQLEHIQSDELISELDKFLAYPRFDPHGDPIPDSEGKIMLSGSVPLSSIKVPGKYIFKGVEDHSKAFLQYVSQNGLSIGTVLTIYERNDYDLSFTISIKNKRKFLSHDASKNILVEKYGK